MTQDGCLLVLSVVIALALIVPLGVRHCLARQDRQEMQAEERRRVDVEEAAMRRKAEWDNRVRGGVGGFWIPDAEHVARVCRAIRDAMPTAKEFDEEIRRVTQARGSTADHPDYREEWRP